MKYDPDIHEQLKRDCYAARLTRVGRAAGIDPTSLTCFFAGRRGFKLAQIAALTKAVREVGPYVPRDVPRAAYYRERYLMKKARRGDE